MSADKLREKTKIRQQRALCPGVFDLILEAPEIAARAKPGQFVNVYLNDASRILPRPLSLCGISPSEGTIRLVYRVTAERAGTAVLSRCQPGTALWVLGPLGKGFPCEDEEDVCVVGGGIGVPPLLEALRALRKRKTAVLGYRSAEQMFLKEEFEELAEEVKVATDDGSYGVHGTVVDAIETLAHRPRALFACGPKPMLRALKQYASAHEIPLWVSMEERMACGIGACLACVTKSAEIDPHSHVKNKRVCKDGPVFRAEEVEL